MRRIGYFLRVVLAVLLVQVWVRGAVASEESALEGGKGAVMYSIGTFPHTAGESESCTFRFYHGDEQVERAAQGTLIRMQVELPSPNPEGWRLRTGSLALYLVEGEEVSVGVPLEEFEFKMPNRDVKVDGHFVKGFLIQNKVSVNGSVHFGKLDGYKANDVVEFDVKADEGCKLDTVYIRAYGSTKLIGYERVEGVPNRYRFRMPENDASVEARFGMRDYSITLVVNVDEKGKSSRLEFDKMEGIHFNDPVIVTPKPAYRYWIKRGSLQMRLKSHQTPTPLNPGYNDSVGSPFMFKMPSDDIEVLVAFERDPRALSQAKVVVKKYVDPAPESEVNNVVEVKYAGTLATVKKDVQEGEKLLVVCRPANGYYLSAVQLLNETYHKDSVTFVVPDVEEVEVRAYFRKQKDPKPDDKKTDVEEMRPVDVYPNPFDDELVVWADDVEMLALYSMEGVLLLSQPYGDGRMHVPNLPEGAYVLRVHFRDGVVSSRRVVH